MRKLKIIFLLSLICFLTASPVFAFEENTQSEVNILYTSNDSGLAFSDKEKTLLSRYIVYPLEEPYSGHLSLEELPATYDHEEEHQNYIWTGTLRLIDCEHWTDKNGNPFTTAIYAGNVYVTV